jgi:hypothetical protein
LWSAGKDRRREMTVRFATEEIGQKYDEFARRYALMERVQEPLGVRRLRRRLLGRA